MKMIEVLADAGSADTVKGLAEKHEAKDFRLGFRGEDDRQPMRVLIADERVQPMLDSLQLIFGKQPNVHIIVLPVEVALPRPQEREGEEADKAAASREALYTGVEKSARLDANFIALVMLSTIVAVLGLIEDNIAVVIGAMVIAPLLGPNLALALATALGDAQLMKKAFSSNIAGLLLVLVLSAGIGLAMPPDLSSGELMARTSVGLDSIALALASGAAATLSLTTGLSSVLVGVMVAVALLPPAATLGLMLSIGHPELAGGAALLLAVNIVSVNLAAKIVFLIKGVRPRTWLEKKRAKRSMIIYLSAWLVSLAILVLAIYSRFAP